MNTPAHLIFGIAAFAKADRPVLVPAAMAGSFIPDLSLYLLAGVHLRLLKTPPEVVFGELYFSDEWQSIFRIDNSMILWGIALALAIMFRSAVMIALCSAAMLHLVGDFLLHHDDGRAHFWPISKWIFESPVSYWDPAHYGGIVGPLEVLAAMICCVIIWRRFSQVWVRSIVVALGLAEFVPFIAFALMFSAP